MFPCTFFNKTLFTHRIADDSYHFHVTYQSARCTNQLEYKNINVPTCTRTRRVQSQYKKLNEINVMTCGHNKNNINLRVSSR